MFCSRICKNLAGIDIDPISGEIGYLLQVRLQESYFILMRRTLSQVSYLSAFEKQKSLVERRIAGEISDCVWYLEHPPVVTWNPGRGLEHLIVSEDELNQHGVELIQTDRGGDVTYHGPGQLVGYPIVDLKNDGPCHRDLHAYMRGIEEAIIQVLTRLDLKPTRVEGRTGVWLENSGNLAKIAAIGVKSRRWVTSHGFALNISCDLTPFRDLIVPCGISDAAVTTLSDVLQERCPSIVELAEEIHRELSQQLARGLLVTYDGESLCEEF